MWKSPLLMVANPSFAGGDDWAGMIDCMYLAPNRSGAIRMEAASMGLSAVIIPPAHSGAVGAQGACVVLPAADGYKSLVWRWRRLSSVIIPPADSGAVGAQDACMKSSATQRGVLR